MALGRQVIKVAFDYQLSSLTETQERPGGLAIMENSMVGVIGKTQGSH
jgi:hypothetical protein